MRQIYLIPGFFGFSRAGTLTYFEGVAEALQESLEKRGVEAEIIECHTQPTASIRRRAERLVDIVHGRGGLEADELHFIGHSTGGLDARLLTTPGVRLRPDRRERKILERTRSVITVATPHYGTPLAGFFTTVLGRQILELLAVLATSWGGRAGLAATAQLISLVARIDDLLGRRETFLDFLARSVLSRVTSEAEGPLWEYLREIASDQGAIVQLMPEAMHLFNAAVIDADRIHYGSVVTVAPPPPLGYRLDSLFSFARAGLTGAFTLLHTLAAREHRHYRYPHPGEDELKPFLEALDFEIDARSNDGIVPTLSQIYGRIIDVVVSDHLDVVGQFHRDDDPHSDWLPSGSCFDEQRFRRVWGRIANEIIAAGEVREEG